MPPRKRRLVALVRLMHCLFVTLFTLLCTMTTEHMVDDKLVKLSGDFIDGGSQRVGACCASTAQRYE